MIAAIALLFTQLPVYASTIEENDSQISAATVFDKKTTDKIYNILKNKPIVGDIKVSSGKIKSVSNISSNRATTRTVQGTYPTRKGVILVTLDAYLGLIPTGHAAITFSDEQVIEALSDGVVWGDNRWDETKTTCYAGAVSSNNIYQDYTAANWCYDQLGKPYNYNFFNTGTRTKFYCSQLVWASFLDTCSVDLNTSEFSTPFGNPVHPGELLSTDLTYLIYGQY